MANKLKKTTLLFCSLLIGISCTIVITSPEKTPFQNDTIEYAYANFGQINYGKTASFHLVHFDNDLCQVSEFQHFNTSTYVLTDDNGSCSYTQKARNVQALGAKGLIIASEIYSYNDRIVPSSDLNGRKVHITVLFISKSTYKRLLYMKDVQIKVNFPIVRKQKSLITFYLQAASRSTYVFLRQFKPIYEQIKNFVNIQLIYFTTPCQHCSESQCILNQKYCAFDMQNYVFGVGSNIVKQQLRQYDIFAKFGADKWFQYMNIFDRFCDFEWKYVAQCSQMVQRQIEVKVDLSTVNLQYVLASWKEKETNYSFLSPTQIAINGIVTPGNLDANILYDSICSSLINGCQPVDYSSSGNLNTTFILLGIFSGALIMLIVGFCCYKKFMPKQLSGDMSSKIGDMVKKYASKVKQMKKKRKSNMIEKLNEEDL